MNNKEGKNKALTITGYGSLRKNLELRDCPIPQMGDDDVLLEIHAASINPIDYKTVKGLARLLVKMQLPRLIGYDVSGVVIDKGFRVTDFEIGDEVFARVGEDRPGTLANFIAVGQKFITKKPSGITHEEAASIPLVGLTVLQAFRMAQVQKGQRVLIHAGSGGIGTFAVQLTKLLGAEAYTTTSTKNVEWVKQLGAYRVIDYKKENYTEVIPEMHFVLDTLGGKYTKESFHVLKEKGMVINLSGPILDRQAVKDLNLPWYLRPLFSIMRMRINPLIKAKKASYRFFLMEPDGEQLQEIAQWMAEGKIKAVIDKVYPFEQAIDALEKLAEGHTKGKLVVKMK